jgi:hypothetical protein
VLDWFTPFNEQILNREDDDLGSGGPLLVPPQPGARHGLALVGGKDGSLFVLDRGHLGKYQESGNSHAVQSSASGTASTRRLHTGKGMSIFWQAATISRLSP